MVYPPRTVTYLTNNQALLWPGFEPMTESGESDVLTTTSVSHQVIRRVWQWQRAPTESDLLSGFRRQEKCEKQQNGDESARYDQVEAVIQRSTSDVDRVRDIDIRLIAAFVLVNASIQRHRCSHHIVVGTKMWRRTQRKYCGNYGKIVAVGTISAVTHKAFVSSNTGSG